VRRWISLPLPQPPYPLSERVVPLNDQKGFEHRLADEPPVGGIAVTHGIPEAHGHPDVTGVPLRHAEDGIKADSTERHAVPEEAKGVLCELMDQRPALLPDFRGFRDDDRVVVALPHGSDEIAEPGAARSRARLAAHRTPTDRSSNS
jgi:hypothetical protein